MEGSTCPQPQHKHVSKLGVVLPSFGGFAWVSLGLGFFALFWLFGRFSWLRFLGVLGFADKFGADMSS